MALLLPDFIMAFRRPRTKALPMDNFFATFYQVVAIGK
jgi:hypothetical protein